MHGRRDDFDFLTSVHDLERSRAAFHVVMAGTGDVAMVQKAEVDLLQLVESASSGRFEVLDARLTAGVADPPAFAQQWAMHISNVPHTLVPSSGTANARGQLHWIRFSTTLWLPKEWFIANNAHADLAKCAQ